jgi:hypothetical protein
MTTQTPANADRGKRSIWFWMWFAFLILAGILEFLAKQDASFQLNVQNFNSKMYSATVALSPLSIGKNYYLYMWSGGEPGVTCHSDWISPPQSLWPSLQTGDIRRSTLAGFFSEASTRCSFKGLFSRPIFSSAGFWPCRPCQWLWRPWG